MTKITVRVEGGTVVLAAKDGEGNKDWVLTPEEAKELGQRCAAAANVAEWILLFKFVDFRNTASLDTWTKGVARSCGVEAWASLTADSLPALCGDADFCEAHPDLVCFFGEVQKKLEAFHDC